MLSKISLSIAIVLATAFGALAATKHQTYRHHGFVARSQVPAGRYGAYDAGGRAFDRVYEPDASPTPSFSLSNGVSPYYQW